MLATSSDVVDGNALTATVVFFRGWGVIREGELGASSGAAQDVHRLTDDIERFWMMTLDGSVIAAFSFVSRYV